MVVDGAAYDDSLQEETGASADDDQMETDGASWDDGRREEIGASSDDNQMEPEGAESDNSTSEETGTQITNSIRGSQYVASHPTVPRPTLRNDEAERHCAICYEPYSEDPVVLPCRHEFDLECLLQWLSEVHSGQNTCKYVSEFPLPKRDLIFRRETCLRSQRLFPLHLYIFDVS